MVYCQGIKNNSAWAFLVSRLEDPDRSNDVWLHPGTTVWLHDFGFPDCDTKQGGIRFAPFGNVDDLRTFYVVKNYDDVCIYSDTSDIMGTLVKVTEGINHTSGYILLTVSGDLEVSYPAGKKHHNVQLKVESIDMPGFYGDNESKMGLFSNLSSLNLTIYHRTPGQPTTSFMILAGKSRQLNWTIPYNGNSKPNVANSILVHATSPADVNEPVISFLVYRNWVNIFHYVFGGSPNGRLMYGASQAFGSQTKNFEFTGFNYDGAKIIPTTETTVENAVLVIKNA